MTPQARSTFTGNRALQIEEPLIFELDEPARSGVDLPEPRGGADRLGGLSRRGPIGLPGLSEPQVVRHYTRLSQKNYGIDSGLFPLGSCTMKHNPRLGETMARLPGFAHIHPLQPQSTVEGALALMAELSRWLLALTGMKAVALSPAAGAHGELCGMLAIRAALEARGEARRLVLVPESAHGTNPATAAALGFSIESLPGDARGRVDLEALKARLDGDVAALMITNPSTCGLFEEAMLEMAEAVHAAGGYVYMDGANFNALMGRVRPADLGADAMHINLHKTFSTPHGGGGPGSGPVVFAPSLVPFAPVPLLVAEGDRLRLIEEAGEGAAAHSFGRLKGFHGQMGMFVRALAYILSHGADGLKRASEDAVLAANYVLAQTKDRLSPAYEGLCMHECLFDDGFLKDTGVSTLDFAKALIDEGYHPPTIYFPLVVHGALLVEPTESESKASLDRFIATLRALAERARKGEADYFHEAPRFAPRRRLDETLAARRPVLRWRPAGPEEEAAE